MPVIAGRSSTSAGRIVTVRAPTPVVKHRRYPRPTPMTIELRGPQIRTALPGPLAAALIERDGKAMSPSFTRAYPFVMDRGEGVWVTDVDGNVFLDCTAGIAVCATGHAHPRVVAAVREQAE